jgi:amidase
LRQTLDVDEVIRVAGSLGMTLGRGEAVVYAERLASKLAAIEEFMRTRIDEERPPLLAPARAPGRRPSAAEDPFNAWLWKCDIRAADIGVLAGKTISFKDHIAVAGVPLTLGSDLMSGYTADFDATVVTRVLAAGGRIIGKNSMDGPTTGWGVQLTGDSARPLNPHRTDHTAGSSSSGSAVAVAAGEVDISFGGDQGGSIRIPASHCGTYGLKPTFGLVSHFGIGFGTDQSVDHTGPLARYVEDVAAALEAVAGYDPFDPRQDRTVPLGMNALASLSDGVKAMRIGVLEEGFVDAEPDVRDAVMAAVDVLVAAGARASRISVPEHVTAGAPKDVLDSEGTRAIFDIGLFGAFARTYYPSSLIAATYSLYHEQTDRLLSREKVGLMLSEFTRRRFRGTAYAKAQNVRSFFKKGVDDALDRVDVLAMPTVVEAAPKYAEARTLEEALQQRRAGLNTRTYNFTGHPALTVPCGRSGGLPIGIQLVGRYYDEPLLLRMAYAFQHSVDWEALIRLPTRDPHVDLAGMEVRTQRDGSPAAARS